MPSLRAELITLTRLGAPVALSQLGMMIMGAVETLLVGHLGPVELAASTLGNVWEWNWLCVGLGLVMGIDPQISQAHGRGDGPATALALQRGLVLALMVSVPICVALLFTRQGLLLLGQDPVVAEAAGRYNLYKLPTAPCFLICSALRLYLQGRTLMLPVTLVMWLGNGVHALLASCLVYGGLGLPALGLIGAAVAESVTFCLMLLGLIAMLRWRLHEGAWRRWDRRSFAASGLLRSVRLGVPVGLQIAFEAWAFSIATFMAGWLGGSAVGGHQVALNLAALAFMIPLGVSQGAATRVGNLVGAGDTAGLKAACAAALLLGAAVMVPPALIFAIFNERLPQLYGDDPEVVRQAAAILPIAAAFQLCDGCQVVASGVLRGLGRPDAGALLSLLGYYVIALPLAYVAAFHWGYGLPGIWGALALGLTLVAVALMLLLRHEARRPIDELASVRSTLPPTSRTALSAKGTWVM